MAAWSIGGIAATGLVAVGGVCLVSGCGTVGYYAQSTVGHLELVRAAKPVSTWLADPTTPGKLKARLVLSQQIRDFAVSELHEPDNASYRRYADLHRPAAVWNVVAAPELSLVPKTWCFAVVGCVSYRGYYDRADADGFAEGLRRAGLDAIVTPVPAYSTLGKLPSFDWLADPLLNTFVGYSEVDLARLVFHELAHQIAFAPGDTEFNESFATAVETIGGERWLAAQGDAAALDATAASDARRDDFRALTRRYRDLLAAIYASTDDDATKRRRKAETYTALRADYATMKATRWSGYAGYDAWMARANNAAFALLASYTGLVPAFRNRFERDGADFVRFYADVRRIAALPSADARRAELAR